jgi:tRNA threonylcarbamoyladenosine biosynthesis protein TsaE
MISHSVTETEQYGEALARLLRSGDIVWLYGDLGAGKTALVRGLARGLGAEERVTSPTYAIVNVYNTPCLEAAHYDMYRLDGFEDLLGAGWDEYENGVRIAEWAERAGDVRGVCVEITDTGETEREITCCFLP